MTMTSAFRHSTTFQQEPLFQWMSLSFNSLNNSKILNAYDLCISALTYFSVGHPLFSGGHCHSIHRHIPKKNTVNKNHRCCCKGWLERFLHQPSDRQAGQNHKKSTTKNAMKMPGRVHLSTKIQDPWITWLITWIQQS